jgi:pimeloyl-ACP methyl ester carboxylesterase
MRPAEHTITWRRLLILCVVCLSAATGCVEDLRTVPRLQRGLTLVLPGIDGYTLNIVNLARGLDDGGVPGAIEVFDWSGGDIFTNLTDVVRNRAMAQRVARRIARYRKAYGDQPVWLVGHSGGAGIALMTAESLPQGAPPIEGAILLAAAVSPYRDLSPALARIRHGVWNCYSPHDVFLNVGTTVAGDMDRDFGPAAGAIGFRSTTTRPVGSQPADAPRLIEIPFHPSMVVQGHYGGHFGWTARKFAATTLAPIIIEHRGTTQVIVPAPPVGSVSPVNDIHQP